jgi:hypothetical protein
MPDDQPVSREPRTYPVWAVGAFGALLGGALAKQGLIDAGREDLGTTVFVVATVVALMTLVAGATFGWGRPSDGNSGRGPWAKDKRLIAAELVAFGLLMIIRGLFASFVWGVLAGLAAGIALLDLGRSVVERSRR